MADKFDDFENKLFGWISRHKLGILLVMAPILIWLMLCIAVACMSGIIGVSMLETNITELHNAGDVRWGDDTIGMWENVFIPIIVQMFNTLGYLMAVMVITYSSVVVYLSFRHAYRR